MVIKNLLRGGDFSSSGANFWTLTDASIASSPVAGNVSSVVLGMDVSTGHTGYAEQNDVTPTEPGKTYRIEYRHYSDGTGNMTVTVSPVNSERRRFASSAKVSAASATWKTGFFDVTMPDGSVGMLVDITTGVFSGATLCLVDYISVREIPAPRSPILTQGLNLDLGATANDTYYGDEFDLAGYQEAVTVLSVTTLTGTAPTLTVTIQSQDEFTNVWYDIVSFVAATGATNERRIVTTGLARRGRVKYVVGGTATTAIVAKVGLSLR